MAMGANRKSMISAVYILEAVFILFLLSYDHGLLVGAPLHQRHADEQNDHQNKGDGGGKVQVVGHILPLNGVADQVELAVAQLLGDIEGADGGDEHHDDAGDHARQAQRPDHPAQHARAVAAQIPGGLNELHVHLGHDGGYFGSWRCSWCKELYTHREVRSKEIVRR